MHDTEKCLDIYENLLVVCVGLWLAKHMLFLCSVL